MAYSGTKSSHKTYDTSPNLTPINRSPAGSRDSSPGPDKLAVLQDESRGRVSPRLPRKTIQELKSGQERRKDGQHDPDDPPLTSSWTFWFERAPVAGTVDYSEGLKPIYTVNTIKEFFSVYNNIKTANLLGPKECYHLMRTGSGTEPRKPYWEDPVNLDGGIWVFKCRKEYSVTVWLELLLAAIGEQFFDCTAEGDDVVGVSIKIRDFETDTLQIWNEKAVHSGSAKVMEKVRELLPDMEIWDHYSSIKEKLSGSRPFYPPTQYRASPPPPSFQTHPYPRGNLPSLHSYPRQPFPPRGHAGGYRRGGQPEYFRYQPQYRPPFQPPIRLPPSNISVSPSRPLS